MRKAVLFRSVAQVLGNDEPVVEAVYMWSRHRYMLPYAAIGFLALFWVAELAGFDELAGQVAIGFGGVAVAVAATTDYRVLAETTGGMYLLRASRIRQVALELIERLSDGVTIEQVGGTVLATDWQVGENRYTVTRSGESSMGRMATSH